MRTVRRVLIMGAGGRDFHDFNVAYRDDPDVEVVAFTAAQIPGIDDRRYPPELAGPRYPEGIPIRPEVELPELIRVHEVDEVVFAYSDVTYDEVMHKAAVAMAAGASFTLPGPDATMLRSSVPVIAVCAARTGCGKSPTSRTVGHIVRSAGLIPILVRHPMPYGDLIDDARPTLRHTRRHRRRAPARSRSARSTSVRSPTAFVVYAGVDYELILRRAEAEADVVIWDGGNNDFSFFRPDLLITVVDPLRPGHELGYHPGEINVRMADVIVVNKVDAASPEAVATTIANVHAVNPHATIVRTASPVTLQAGAPIVDRRVLVIEDGPTITHGGMPFGAGTVAARHAGVTAFVDPRPIAVGSIATTYRAYPHIGPVLPAMGYGADQLADLRATIAASECEVVVNGSPSRLSRLLDLDVPVLDVTYRSAEVGSPTLADVLAPWIDAWR